MPAKVTWGNTHQQQRYKVPSGQLATRHALELQSLGDGPDVRRALLEAVGYLEALTGADDPATRGTARDALRAVARELHLKPNRKSPESA